MKFSGPDLINGLFEAFGAWAVWMNVARLRRDRCVRGVTWQYTIVYWIWGMWNLFYYPDLHQWLSTAAGAVLVAGNLVWVWFALEYRKNVATN